MSLKDEIIKEIKQDISMALSTAVQKGYAYGIKKAEESYKSEFPLKFWKSGYNFSQVDDETFIISLKGDMAEIFDEGKMAKVQDRILKGNRAKANAGEGKDYVDVPFGQGPGNSNSKVKINMFKDADAMMKQFTRSAPKSPTRTQKRNAMVRRAKAVVDAGNREIKREAIESKESNTPVKYLTITRITKNSAPWRDYSGAPNIFGKNRNEMVEYIEKEFNSALNQLY